MSGVLKYPVLTGIRRMFLLVSPNETSFEKLEDVPNYVDEAVPFFISLVLLEWAVLYRQGKKPRLNDALGSLSNGLLSLLHGLLFRSTELAGFLWAYTHFNVITLPWDKPATWVLALLGVDFAYYWVHRFGHEVNFMWAGHQLHHNSEDYNLTTALRQSIMHRYSNWVFYLPMALFIPPSMFLVHTQFNLIYQFWVHTETIGKLGPLEWILSTPSHHRVHHGRNPYCIDKNYGGIFIIWDRMFGTFEAEREDEKVVYGLVHNINTWEPLQAQLHHLIYIMKTAWQMEGLSNKISVMLKGPGWSPGKPRLGLNSDIPQIEPNPVKYDIDVGVLRTAYIWAHYLIILLVWHPMLAKLRHEMSSVMMAGNIVYIVYSLFVFGSLYDKKWYADYAEMVRVWLFVVIWISGIPLPVSESVCWFYATCAVVWTLGVAMATVSNSDTVNKKQK
ncbi:alkylglycerol monooxygenase-like isoform X2 [Mya arenaria]|uniref:alkylglycerol monooxygenase-like isoform X2 n=1 Tax=Mya arenaria TaxID=6604 RepID=UPI0022E95C65|nr:alkylglycerol monooxygenase-like isoform X2 [Mya arenaria]